MQSYAFGVDFIMSRLEFNDDFYFLFVFVFVQVVSVHMEAREQFWWCSAGMLSTLFLLFFPPPWGTNELFGSIYRA